MNTEGKKQKAAIKDQKEEKNSTSPTTKKWASNDETWGGNIHPKNKILINGLVERYMKKANSNELEVRVMEDWMKK